MIESAQEQKSVAKAGKGARFKLLSAMKRNRILATAAVACLVTIVYWSVVASDRYVSEATLIIQRTDLNESKSLDFGALLGGSATTNRPEQLLLRNYMLSRDMLAKLDAKLHLRTHYSDTRRDPLSRLWSKDTPQERFYDYYLSRVTVDFDEYAGVLVVRAQAFDPRMAQAITRMLVAEGETAMNDMAHALAQDQVNFIQKQVSDLAARYAATRQAVLHYQNTHGMLAPDDLAAHLNGAIDALQAKRTELQTRRTAELAYLAPQAPGIVELETQIAAVDAQISAERARLTAPTGNTLNSKVEEYQRLQLEAGFAQDVYKTALTALERGRVEATRDLKKVTLLESPTLPEQPVQPRRLYNITVFILMTLLLAGIAHLLAAIIRDHKE
jgi:capsular polysaccharide transport system permease protein